MHVTLKFHEYLPFNPPCTKRTGQNWPFLPGHPETAGGRVVEVCASKPVTWVRAQAGSSFSFFFLNLQIIIIMANHNFGPLKYWGFDDYWYKSHNWIKCVFRLLCLLSQTEIIIINGNPNLDNWKSHFCVKY